MLKSLFTKIKQLNKMSFIIIPLLAIQLIIPINLTANAAVNGSRDYFSIIKFTPAHTPPNYVTYNLGDTVNISITIKNITNSNKSLELKAQGYKCQIDPPPLEPPYNCGTDLRYDSEIKTYNFKAKETKTISFSFVPNQIGYWQVDVFDPPYNPGIDITKGAIIKVIGNPKLGIEKTVRNISNNENFSDYTEAKIGDELEFKLDINSIGNLPIYNAIVWDKLPNGLDYIKNSTTIDNQPVNDGITESGISIGAINGNITKIIKFNVKVSNEFFNGETNLINYGYAKIANQNKYVYDTAKIKIIKEPQYSNLIIEKYARGENETNFSKFANAKNGEEVEFLIKVKAQGNISAKNVKIWDKLPSKLSYIEGSTAINDEPINDDSIITDGINIDEIGINETVEITFRAEVVNYNCPISEIVTNYAYGKINEKSQIYSDYAKIKITKCNIPQNGELTISKLGRNFSKNKFLWVENVSAQPGDIIEFSIQIKNIKNTTITNVYAYDILPDKMIYINNSTTIDNQSVNNDLINNNKLFLGNLSAYQTKTIKFKAKLLSSEYFPANYTTTITNNAYAYGDNVNQVSDTASISVFYTQYIPQTPTPTPSIPTPTPTRIQTPAILGATDVKTGPEDSIIFISILSFILTCGLFAIFKKMKQNGLISAIKLKALIMKIKFNELFGL